MALAPAIVLPHRARASSACGNAVELPSVAAAAGNDCGSRSVQLRNGSGLGVRQWRMVSAAGGRIGGGFRNAARGLSGGCRSELSQASPADDLSQDELDQPLPKFPSSEVVFNPQSNFPKAPPEFLEKEEARIAEMAEKTGISIRRHPATGQHTHNCGAFQFKLQNDGNTPRNILEEIVWNKDVEVDQMKDTTSSATLMKAIKAMPPTKDFIGALRESYAKYGQPALIAEVKKASPSRGVIQPNFDPVRIAQAYESGGAACLSVLTDSKFFQGSYENLKLIRDAGVQCPLLCKEFIIDAWQLLNARAHGADAVLLIAAVLGDGDLRYFSKIASGLGLAVLVEVHSEVEMLRVLELPNVQLIGINNRNLTTFKVDLNNTVDLLGEERRQKIAEKGIMVVGESGIFTPDDIKFVQDAGVGAVLVGESLVKQNDPVAAIKKLYGRESAEPSKAELEVAAPA